MIIHEEQQKIWNDEHTNPCALLQMDSNKPSGGVVKFWDFIKEKSDSFVGIEMGCGKGRNSMWLAQQSEVRKMIGFDFSQKAIEVAQERAKENNLLDKVNFLVGDAIKPWPYENDSFDFAIDCFASTDIESKEGRELAISEIYRVLKQGGYLLAYILTPENEFHKEMIAVSPAEEKNSFYHKTGKFEKTFDEQERKELYKNFTLVKEKIIEKTTQFFDKDYKCYDCCMILQKQ